tara:strand:+ start:1530 stop:2669 length:1140 start_codon:yes stop_codon:yes gene_type:complete
MSREPKGARARRLRGLIVKETRQVMRDPSNLLVAVFLPLLLLFLFGYGISLDPRSYNIGLVVEQPTPETGSFTAALINSRVFRIETARDRRAFEPALVAGDIRGIVVLAADFSDRLYRGESAPIQVIVDGADPNTARLVEGYLDLLWANWLVTESLSRSRALLPLPITVEPQFWYNPELASRYSLIPGSMAIILTLIGALLTALVVAREWERGTMEALLATPIGRAELLLGKIVPYFLLGMGSMLLSTAVAVTVFGVPFRGSFLMLAVVSAVFMLSALGQGLLISTVTRNQLVAAQASILSAFLPAFYFSNFVFEVDSMPWPLRVIAWVVPANYYVSSLQTLFLTGDVWPVLLPDLAALLAIALGFFVVMALTTRTRLD